MENYNSMIQKLIKSDFDLEQIKKLMYIISRTNTKTIEKWNMVFNYLKKYTEKTKEHHAGWTFERSVDIYYYYLKTFEKVNVSLFPKEDMYYIIQKYENNLYYSEERVKKEALKMALEELKEDDYLGNFVE